MRLTILRGIHDMTMIDDVVRLSRDADVIFYECVDTKEEKMKLNKHLIMLEFSQEFADSDDARKLGALPNLYYRWFYEIRGREIMPFPVDHVLKEGETLQEYVGSNMNILTGGILVAYAKTGDFDAFYTALGHNLEKIMAFNRRRDALVADQVKSYIELMEQQGTRHENIVLFQGFMHESKPYLQKLLPDLEIKEVMFGKETFNRIMRLPENRLALNRLAYPKRPMERRFVAMLIVLTLIQLQEDPDPEGYDDIFQKHAKYDENSIIKRALEIYDQLRKLDEATLLERAEKLRLEFQDELEDDNSSPAVTPTDIAPTAP